MSKITLRVSGMVFLGITLFLSLIQYKQYEVFIKDFWISPTLIALAIVSALALSVWNFAVSRN